MDASEFGKLARQGLDTHLEFVKRRTEILALIDRISLALREEFKIPDLALRFRADSGSGNSDNEGSLGLSCMKTTKDRRQLSLEVDVLVLPSEQGEKGRLGDFDFETVEDFQQLLAYEMRRPRFGSLMKKLIDGCRFDPPKSSGPHPSVAELLESNPKMPVPDSMGDRGVAVVVPPPSTDAMDRLRIVWIVNGHDYVTEAHLGASVKALRDEVLTKSGNIGRSPEEWEVRDEAGTYVNPDATVSSLKLRENSRLFVSLRMAAGGTAPEQPDPIGKRSFMPPPPEDSDDGKP